MKELGQGRLLHREVVYDGRIVGLEVDKVQVKGIETIREVVRHPGGVVVLAEVGKNRIPFVRQYRYPIGTDLLELPAGKVDQGEDPSVSAARELEEETGFRAKSLQPICNFYSSPGFCDELLHFYYTNDVYQTTAKREQDEEITLEFYSLEDALEMALRGEILDAKSIAALFWLSCRRHQEQSQSSYY
jgi:ADP-ribose pyrophosphatase